MADTTQALQTTNQQRGAYLLLLGVMLFGGLSFILARLAQEEGIPTPVIVLIRLTTGALILSAVAMRRGVDLSGLKPRHYVLIALAGSFLAGHFLMGYWALEYTTVTVVSLMLLTGPVWVLLCEMLFLKMVPSVAMRYGLIISLIGGVLVALGSGGGGFGSAPLLGALYALFSALSISFYMFLGRVVRSHIDSMSYIWLVFIASAVAAGLVMLTQQTPITGYSLKGYFWVLLLTLIAQVYAQSVINYVLGIFSATFVSIALRAVNVMATIYAIFIFNEIPTIWQVIGGALILSGVVITSRRPAQKHESGQLD